MTRRLKWFLAGLVVMGVAYLLVPARGPEDAGEPGLGRRLSIFLANHTVPRHPPADPPPGRPFAAHPVTYTTAPPTSASLRKQVSGTNVIICVLDAARVDHFRAYGYPRETTPNFDRLAADGVLFEQHFCQAPLTRPSTLSLFTGLYPDTHGFLENSPTEDEPASPPRATVERAFAEAGYRTYLVTSAQVVTPQFGLGGDFQHVLPPRGGDPIEELQAALPALLREWKTGRAPFLAYFHVFPPHGPYHAPASFQRAFRGRPPRYWRGPSTGPAGLARDEPPSWVEWGNQYDANLRWADSFLADLEAGLRANGLSDRTLLIITADHGEALREHGYPLHPNCPYDEALHIPLLVRFPGGPKPMGQVHALTQTIDLFPTLADLYGLPSPRVQGVSLLPLLSGETQEANRYLVSRIGTAGAEGVTYAIRDAHRTLLLRPEGRRQLFDMDADPWQVHDSYAQPRAAALERAFATFARGQAYPPAGFGPSKASARRPHQRLTETQRKTLKALGYVE